MEEPVEQVARISLAWTGMAVLPLYLVATLFIGRAAARRHSSANDFLNASRSLPLWIVVASFISANCGALEIVGLSAVAAQYGVRAFHFYWIGAIPGMVFLGGVMIPIYMRSGVRSLPEYLERRFDARIRLVNAWLILAMGTALSGIGLYAMAQVLHVVFGYSFWGSALLAATVVFIYVLLGGVRATIYNEVLQLAVIVLGLLPLLWLHTNRFHSASDLSGSHWHLWTSTPILSPQATLDGFGIVAGLGFVLSFSYWCTDFVLIQRALAARSVEAARMVPLLAGLGKLVFSILVITPSLGAAAYLGHRMPAAFDQTLPALMKASYGPALLWLGLTALTASLMTGLAANVSAFSAVWTEEIYRPSLCRSAPEAHYLLVGRISIFVAIGLSIATSSAAFYFKDMMEYVQLIFSLCGAPFFAVFILGIFTRRATARGVMIGLFAGLTLSFLHHGMIAADWIHYGSLMSANFYVAIYAFAVSLAIGLVASRRAERKSEAQLATLVYSPRADVLGPTSTAWWLLAGALLAACVVLNLMWK
jgi:SSS family solute:Na+ symporter